jgi:hypothetical protein
LDPASFHQGHTLTAPKRGGSHNPGNMNKTLFPGIYNSGKA